MMEVDWVGTIDGVNFVFVRKKGKFSSNFFIVELLTLVAACYGSSYTVFAILPTSCLLSSIFSL